MSKVAHLVGIIATVVAVGAAIAATFGGLGIAGVALLTTISAVAGAVAGVANAVAVATQKPPDLKGAVNQVLIGANMPVPLTMGRTYYAGNMVYDDSNGSAGSDNSDRTMIMVGSVGGPIEGFESFQADFAPIGFTLTGGGTIKGKATDAWYGDGAGSGWFWVNSRLGLLPDTALTPFSGRAAFRDWGSANKLSGMPCWSATMAFDLKGKRYSGGIPAFGMIAKWVKTYDPRKDSSYPGGSGAQRWDDETTWQYGTGGTGYVAQGENPALQALAYARGRFENGIKVVGVGLDEADINLARFVEGANLCDANNWVLGGTIYEGPGISKWDNLKRICASFGAQPIWSGGLLDLKLNKPVVAIDTITRDDLAGDTITVPAMKSWRDRINTIVPRYRSEPHRWDYVQSDAVTNSTYVTEDGETKTKEVQYDLVQAKDQAAQLAAYELVNGREYGPIQLTCKPRLMLLRVGEAVNLNLASLLDDATLPTAQTVTVLSRAVDPGTGVIRFTFESETSAKHAWALARTGTAPPTPTILTPGDVDQAVSDINDTVVSTVLLPQILRASYAVNLEVTSTDAGSNATIHMFGRSGGAGTDFSIEYAASVPVITAVPAHDITGLAYSTTYYLYVDVTAVGDNAPTYGATTVYGDALNSATNPNRIYLAQEVTTPAAGSPPTGGDGSGGGYGGCVTTDTLIMMADGSYKSAGKIEVGDILSTQHEHSLDWGEHEVISKEIENDQIYRAELNGTVLYATARHRVHVGDRWVTMEALGVPNGKADIVKMVVKDAHTYISNGLLSHNLKVLP